jgi:hypothetical protein
MYLKNLLEKASISQEKTSKIIEIFIKAPHFSGNVFIKLCYVYKVLL